MNYSIKVYENNHGRPNRWFAHVYRSDGMRCFRSHEHKNALLAKIEAAKWIKDQKS